MALNQKPLVYFEFWLDPIAPKILAEQDDIDLVRLEYSSREADNWKAMERAVGYNVHPRTELKEPWFGNDALIKRSPNMLALCSAGAGYDYIDVEAATKAGIIVCNQSGTNHEPVAEHALAMILSLSKKIGVVNRAIQKHDNVDRMQYAGNDILGKTVGIIGIGKIGGRLSEMCKVFSINVLAYDPYLTKEQIAAKGATKVELKELLAQSDFISIHCPRSKETLGMIGAPEFALMKPTTYFINTARGGIHKEADLVEALKAKKIQGAGIDVFDKEPPPSNHPLLQFENVIATPHVAGMTVETMQNMCKASAEQWMALLRGKVPPRLVNPEVWPRYSERFEKIIGFRPDALN
jgi:D-3-phosphoglycerate dehydrogenase / 2-oxoglutarate reductase